MDDSDPAPAPASGAAEAFDGLRQQIKLMRKALAALVDEQRGQPDYSETLGKITDDLSKTDRKVGWLANRAALTLTPQEIATQITMASVAARAADQSLIIQTVEGRRQATGAIGGLIEQARTTDQQNRRLVQVAGVAGVVGLLLGIVLPMAALKARRLPGRGWNEALRSYWGIVVGRPASGCRPPPILSDGARSALPTPLAWTMRSSSGVATPPSRPDKTSTAASSLNPTQLRRAISRDQ